MFYHSLRFSLDLNALKLSASFLNARVWRRFARTDRRKILPTAVAERRQEECNYMKTAAYCKACRHALVCRAPLLCCGICLGCCPPVVLMRVFSTSLCCSCHTYKEGAHGGGDPCCDFLLSVCLFLMCCSSWPDEPFNKILIRYRLYIKGAQRIFLCNLSSTLMSGYV